MREWINTTADEVEQLSLNDDIQNITLIPRPDTSTTLVDNNQSPVSEASSSARMIVEAVPPPDAKLEECRKVHRALPLDIPAAGLLEGSGDSEKTMSDFSRHNLVRMFSNEIDEMNEYMDGRPPTIGRQISDQSISMYDEYFSDQLDSCSQIYSGDRMNDIEPSTPKERDVLFKVARFSQIGSPEEVKSPLSRGTPSISSPCTPVEETFRQRKLSVGKQSSRCSTPQTIKCG